MSNTPNRMHGIKRNSKQLTLFSDSESYKEVPEASCSTFVSNMQLPVHRWFRFSAGFSAQWAENVIRENGKETRVLDPFAGSGTALLAAEKVGLESIGIEAHPFIARVAKAKLNYSSDPEIYLELADSVLGHAKEINGQTAHYPVLIKKCYDKITLERLDRLRQAVEKFKDDSPAWFLVWLTLVAILRTCSYVGTAQWQYVLPNKSKKSVAEPFEAFYKMAEIIYQDMNDALTLVDGPKAKLVNGDARTCEDVPDNWATLVITSPPYPNNYDYADSTRLEMCFLGEIKAWGDLQNAVRQYLMRSCTQHVPPNSTDLDSVLLDDALSPIRAEIIEVCNQLRKIRLTKGGKKTYHLMVACYFLDMARCWIALKRACNSGAKVCFVIGDSAPYGVFVPVIEWMGKLSEAAGFRSWCFEKTRDRNIKWKNRKHRVPLCEGRFWTEV